MRIPRDGLFDAKLVRRCKFDICFITRAIITGGDLVFLVSLDRNDLFSVQGTSMAERQDFERYSWTIYCLLCCLLRYDHGGQRESFLRRVIETSMRIITAVSNPCDGDTVCLPISSSDWAV
jgi:hypothetical protein